MAGTCDVKKVFEMVAKLYEENLDESGDLKKEDFKNAILDTLDPETREKCQGKLEAKMKRGGKKGKGKKGGKGGQGKKGDGKVNMCDFKCFMRVMSMGILNELKCEDDDDDDDDEDGQQE